MIDAAIIAGAETAAAELMVRAPSLVALPTRPVKVILLGPAVKLRQPGPSTVLEKRIFDPITAVVRVVHPVRMTGPSKAIRPLKLVVAMEPANWTAQAPV